MAYVIYLNLDNGNNKQYFTLKRQTLLSYQKLRFVLSRYGITHFLEETLANSAKLCVLKEQ